MKKFFLLLVFALMINGCTSQASSPKPGAVTNQNTSKTKQTTVVAEEDAAVTQYLQQQEQKIRNQK